MPTLSASDYTQYLKFKAAAATPIRPAIQTRANVTLSQSALNANILASQAALVVNPAITTLSPVLARVRPRPVVQTRSNPDALSTVGWASGQSISTTSSSKFQQPGGLPTGFKGSQGTYTRLPQQAGWARGAEP
jgi:hypothetical protein